MARSLSFLRLFCIFALVVDLVAYVSAQQTEPCDTEHKCVSGCCNKNGACGFGDGWCDKANCIGTCDAKAECGAYAASAKRDCPLNVCCSQWGYCGTTSEFCEVTSNPKTSCQSNCVQPTRKICPSQWRKRVVAYYETWADNKTCNSFRPEDIPVKAITHLNVAFAGIGPDHRLVFDDLRMLSRISKLKRRNPGLKIFISVGGWTFSDEGPTRTAWSDMARTIETRDTFIESVILFLLAFNFDGIDLDWEYPEADDRGGVSADFGTYPNLLTQMRNRFDGYNRAWGISIAIPASYWYLQHFDLARMAKSVSWFNLMSYDIHGKWDKGNKWTGAYVLGHTNVTEIESGLDLLRRNNIEMSQVNLGIGFYGRTFTLLDPACNTPGCGFSDAGQAGECSGEAGILTFKEIMARKHRLNEQQDFYDEPSGVKYMLYDQTQWITYDDAQSFKKKREILDTQCFGGAMIWAIDQDTSDFQALSGFLGDDIVTSALVQGGIISDEEKAALSEELGGLTGDGCYVTLGCSGPDSRTNKFNTCNPGDIAIERLHAPGGSIAENYGTLAHEASNCKKGQWKNVCCSSKSPALNCRWVGAPLKGQDECSGGHKFETCGISQYELATDLAVSFDGDKTCTKGARSLCCDSDQELRKCQWTGCTSDPACAKGVGNLAIRGDTEGGPRCPPGQFQALCCSNDGPPPYNNCQWEPGVKPPETKEGHTIYFASTAEQCMTTTCPRTQVTIAKSWLPGRPAGLPPPCGSYSTSTIHHRLCCDPPRDLSLPFDLAKLFPKPEGQDVVYEYKNNYGNNDRDKHGADGNEFGDDPYGFVVLDGSADALHGDFPKNFVVVHDEDESGNNVLRRSLLSDDPSMMNTTFEHEESTHFVYCKIGRESGCAQVFYKGAPDTIIRLPGHIGSGPFARIVAMDPTSSEVLPDYHLKKRSDLGHKSTVYRLKIDYAFDQIQRPDAHVNLRVDYTNLVPYWSTMSGRESPKGNVKRNQYQKTWWGTFPEWLKKMASIEVSDEGKLPMTIRKKFLLYRRRANCARGNIILKAGLDITCDFSADMNARWAYYAEGSLLPKFDIPTVYAYFEIAPEVQAILEIDGNAEIAYQSQRIKIIDTISYPGLAIKGIAAIGPTLDVWASMSARAQIAGKLRAGAKIKFPKQQIYFPQTADAKAMERFGGPASEDEKKMDAIPILDANVVATVGVDVFVTPEVNLGIKVAPKTFGTVLDVGITGAVDNQFTFQVQANASIGIGKPAAASYDIFLKYFYNFRLEGRGVFKWIGDWKIEPITLWPAPGRQIVLYEHHGEVTMSKRSYFSSFLDQQSNASIALDQGWQEETELGPRLFNQLLSLPDVPSFFTNNSFFNCNDGGKCKSGGCSGGSCEWNPKKPPAKLHGRADDPPGEDTDPVQVCHNAVPAFMYNCKFFPDESTLLGPATGICHNILNHFSAAGLGTGPFLGTFKMAGTKGLNINRNLMCGSGSKHTFQDINPETKKLQDYTMTWADRCTRESNKVVDATSPGKPHLKPGNSNVFSCDEFPFNSYEEGGSGVRACVPGYQQNVQGNCNQLPKRITQEVTWYNEAGEEKTAQKSWDSDWASDAAYGPRTKEPNKDRNWNWARNNRKSLTHHLFNSDNGNTPLGTSWELFDHDSIGTDIGTVVAAFNLLNNPKYTAKDNKNGWCWTGKYTDSTHDWWDKPENNRQIKLCTVVFDTTAAVEKLKRGITPTQDELFNITGVTIAKDSEDWP